MYDIKKIKEPEIKSTYKSINNFDLPMWIYLPEQKIQKPKTVICIHGGGWTTGIPFERNFDGGHMKYQADYFSKQGNIGVVISYRSLKSGAHICDIVSDCADAINYLVENFEMVDKSNIVIMGDSAGAQLCFSVLCDNFLSVVPKAVILCNPVADLNKEKWHYVENNVCERTKFSPIHSISDIVAGTSFLIMHGLEDVVAEIEDSEKLHILLLEKGFKSEFIALKDAKHAFVLFNYQSRIEHVIEYMKIIDKFISKC